MQWNLEFDDVCKIMYYVLGGSVFEFSDWFNILLKLLLCFRFSLVLYNSDFVCIMYNPLSQSLFRQN